jgi:hypothetical protein
MADASIKEIEHLGDGVYAGHDGWQVWVRANNHHFGEWSETPDVALEPRVLFALIDYAERKGLIKRKPENG